MLFDVVGETHRRSAWRSPNVMLIPITLYLAPHLERGAFLRIAGALFDRKHVPLQALFLVVALAACTADTSIYEANRGAFPADYKQKVKTAIESRWPVPRNFRVLAISTPTDGFLLRPGTFHAVFGAWIGCVQVEGDKERGAEFNSLYAPYAIGSGGTEVVLKDERQCWRARYEPWLDMLEGSEI